MAMKQQQLNLLFISTTTTLIIITIAIIIGIYNQNDNNSKELILHPMELNKNLQLQLKFNEQFVIIIDGGSTGSRIHIFLFEIDNNRLKQRIKLLQEYFYHIEPGISSFNDDYDKNFINLDKNLNQLIEKAMEIIPMEYYSKTPILLKATAGLRLLPLNDSNRILKFLRKKFKLLPFKLLNDNCIDILNENDEGLFAWYTVNFLQKKLHKINESIITLDLGGGSTQLAFSTYNLKTIIQSNQYIVQRYIEGEQEFLYTHSYLGLGLMSARYSLLLQTSTNVTMLNQDEYLIKNSCFKILSNNNGGKTLKWKHDNTIFHIQYDYSEDNWFNCLLKIENFIKNLHLNQPDELKQLNQPIYAISYFFDRIKDINSVIHHNETLGRVRLNDFFHYSENICNNLIIIRKKPFLCMDLTYIAIYLHYGLGIPMTREIILVKKLNGIEISWALGAAINLF